MSYSVEIAAEHEELLKFALLDVEVIPRYETIGPDFGDETPQIIRRIQRADNLDLALALHHTGEYVIGQDRITEDHVEIVFHPRQYWTMERTDTGIRLTYGDAA